MMPSFQNTTRNAAMLFLLQGLVRPVTSVRQFQFPEFGRADGAGKDVLAVDGVQMAEGDVDEPFVALVAIHLQGAKEAHGRQELSGVLSESVQISCWLRGKVNQRICW